MPLILFEKTVATAGVRVPLRPSTTNVQQATIQAKDTNTGKIFVGDSSVTSAVSMQLGFPQPPAILPVIRLVSASGQAINLSSIYIDAEVSGEGVNVLYEPF